MNDLIKGIDEVINNLQTIYDQQETPDATIVLQLDRLYKQKLDLIKVDISADGEKYKELQETINIAAKTSKEGIDDINKVGEVILTVSKTADTILNIVKQLL